MDRFKIIEGGGKPKKHRKKGKAEMLVCPCGCSETIETRTARFVRDGKVSAGTKQIRCFRCNKILV